MQSDSQVSQIQKWRNVWYNNTYCYIMAWAIDVIPIEPVDSYVMTSATRLQGIQTSLGWTVTSILLFSHITHHLKALHWLPVCQCIDFKGCQMSLNWSSSLSLLWFNSIFLYLKHKAQQPLKNYLITGPFIHTVQTVRGF